MSVAEDAAVLLADFVSSLDNLPSEEIGHKEARAFDFKNRANSRDQSIQKHARPASQGGAGLLQPNPKEETSIAKIRSDLTHAEATAKEKLALSERGVKLLERHLNRLSSQLEVLTPDVPPLPTLPSFAPAQPTPAPPSTSYEERRPSHSTPQSAQQYSQFQPDRRLGTPSTPTAQVPLLPAQLGQHQPQLSQPHPAGQAAIPNPYAFSTPVGNNARLNNQRQPSRLGNAIYPSPGAGTPGSGAGAGGARTPTGANPGMSQAQQQALAAQALQLRQMQVLQQQQHAEAYVAAQKQHLLKEQARQAAALAAGQPIHNGSGMGMGMIPPQHGGQQQPGQVGGNNKRRRDQEEEAEAAEDGDGEDLTPYCFCARPSFGEMIGCDAPDCKIEWFHLNCVGLKSTPEGSWYCSDCEARQQKQGTGRKRR